MAYMVPVVGGDYGHVHYIHIYIYIIYYILYIYMYITKNKHIIYIYILYMCVYPYIIIYYIHILPLYDVQKMSHVNVNHVPCFCF